MGRHKHFIKLAILFFFLPYTAQAQEPLIPINFSGHYDFAFSGLVFGGADVSLNQTDTHYDATSDIAITGLAKLFIEHTSHTTSKGTGKGFVYDHTTYESRYQTRKKPKYVKMVTKNGKFTLEKAEPADNRAVRPLVAASDKNGASDPLLLALSLRSELARCMKASCTHFSQNFYDGRRLTKLDIRILNERNIRIRGQKYPAYQLAVRRTPLGGYTQKELSNIGKNDPTLNVFFSHDNRLIPLLLEVPLAFGLVSAALHVNS